MNLDRIRDRLGNGFKPLVIELSSGRRVPVPHPDFIMLGKNFVVVMSEDDSVRTIDALHIASIADLPAGRRRK